MNNSSIEIASKGEVSLSERHKEPRENGTWGSDTLLNIMPHDEIEIDVSFDIEDGVSISISSFHVKNEISKRIFHSTLKIYLLDEDIKDIHSYLGFLINSSVIK